MATLGQRFVRFLTELFRVCLEGSLCGELVRDEPDNVTVNLRTNIKCCNKQSDVNSSENIGGDGGEERGVAKPAWDIAG